MLCVSSRGNCLPSAYGVEVSHVCATQKVSRTLSCEVIDPKERPFLFSNISNFRPSIPPIFLIRHQSQESQCQTRVTKIKTKVFVWLTTLDIYKKYLICCIYQIFVCRHLLLVMYFSIILTDFTHYTRNQDSCLTNFDLFSLTYFFIMYLFIWKPKACKLVRNNLSIHVTFYKFCKRNR